MIEVADIADRLGRLALELCQELLPNGHRDGHVWRCSGIADTGGSTSMWVYLTGAQQGHWRDAGNCPADEQHGDMIDLIRLRQCGGDMRAAVREAKRRLGIEDAAVPGAAPQMSAEERARRAAQAEQRRRQKDEELQRERESKMVDARRLYLRKNSVPIARTPVDFYLRGRMLRPDPLPAWPNALRFNPDVTFKPEGTRLPAMLAPVYRADGTHVATHRTFLRNDPVKGWCKIDHRNAKMVLGPVGGGFVPINKGSSRKSMAQMPEGEPVYMTEGIEDALVVRMMKPQARIVAAVSLGNIGAVVLPEKARQLIVVCDRDEDEQAQDTLERSIGQQQARGLAVSLVMPPIGVKDLNDWLQLQLRGAA